MKNHELITSEEFYEKYYSTDSYYWEHIGIHAYNAILKAEKRLNKTTAKKVKKEVAPLEEMSLSELNALSLKIANEAMKEFPNTWEDKLKKDKEYKKIKKQIKIIKNDR